MIKLTDLRELEVSLPGDWRRKDTGDTYSFTADQMHINDERLFRQVYIRHPKGTQEAAGYALTLEDDYCGILVGRERFIIHRLAKFSDGSAVMEWEDRAGGRIVLERLTRV
ncbi:MAG TPA: hypothetical protein VN616_08105 [Puia sp.]|nr:hypothetical protein [Puia sp.]